MGDRAPSSHTPLPQPLGCEKKSQAPVKCPLHKLVPRAEMLFPDSSLLVFVPVFHVTFSEKPSLTPCTDTLIAPPLAPRAMLSRSVTSYSLRPHGLQPARLHCPWDSPGKNTGVGCPFLLQGIFPTQGSNPCLLQWEVGSLPLGEYHYHPGHLTCHSLWLLETWMPTQDGNSKSSRLQQPCNH